MEFGQFCPIAKSTEILGQKWTILILRELLMGSSNFNQLQRGLGTISTAILSQRLQSLVDYELVTKKKKAGLKGYQYFPTAAAKELLPIFVDLGNWGMRWTRKFLTTNDFDPEFLILYLQRSIQPAKLSGEETIIKFQFTDVKHQPNWWILVKDQQVDVCTLDPGREVDVYFTCSVVCLSGIWMGESSYKKEIAEGNLQLVGRRELTKNVTSWMSNCMFSQK